MYMWHAQLVYRTQALLNINSSRSGFIEFIVTHLIGILDSQYYTYNVQESYMWQSWV